MYSKIKKASIVKQVTFMTLLIALKKFKWINKIYQKKVAEINKIANLKFSIKKIKLTRYNCFELQNIEVEKGFLIIRINKINIHLSLFHFLKGRFQQSLIINIGEIHISKVTRENSPTSKSDVPIVDPQLYEWEEVYYNLFKKYSAYLFQKHPDLLIEAITVKVGSQCLRLKNFSYIGDLIATSIVIESSTFRLEGKVNRSPRSIMFTSIKPVFTDEYNYQEPAFNYLCFEYHESIDNQLGISFINIIIKIEGLTFNNMHISDDRSLANDIEIDIQIEFNEHNFRITEKSGGSINQVPFAFEFLHDIKENDLIRAIFYVEIDGDLLLKAFPKFHNENIRTLSFEGSITFKFSLMFLINNPYNHHFDVEILSNNINVTDTGNFDLSYLNTYYYDKAKGFFSGFSRLDKIESVKLSDINSILLNIFIFTEDPNFYTHKGIDPQHIGYAIVDNIVQRRFARGASTITMQVARNLFLSHNKTMFRKMEEAIITLLIENHFKIPKSRLLEIYLNIIEFGPAVYGIYNASNFYFSKKPIDLTLLESIVLSYVIPRPNHFHDALQLKTPQLLTNLPTHVKQVSKALLKKKLITQNDYDNLGTEIQFGNNLGKISLN